MARVRYILEIESEFTPEIEALTNVMPAIGPPPVEGLPADTRFPKGPWQITAVPDRLSLLASNGEVPLVGGGRARTFGSLNLSVKLPDDSWIEVRAKLTEEHVGELMAHLPRVQANLMAHNEPDGFYEDDEESEAQRLRRNE